MGLSRGKVSKLPRKWKRIYRWLWEIGLWYPKSVGNQQPGTPCRRKIKGFGDLVPSGTGVLFPPIPDRSALKRVPAPNFLLQLTFGHGSDLEQCPVFNLQLLGVMELAVFPPRMGQVVHDAGSVFVIIAQDHPPVYPFPILYPPAVKFFVF